MSEGGCGGVGEQSSDADRAALKELAGALPDSVRPVLIFGELRARSRAADICVTVTVDRGVYSWEWGEPIDADPKAAGYLAAVAARVCTVLALDPPCTGGTGSGRA